MRFIMENKITKSLVIIGGGPAGLKTGFRPKTF